MKIEGEKLKSQRLILDQVRNDDAKIIQSICSNPKVSKNLLTVPSPYTIDDSLWWINHIARLAEDGRQYNFALRLKNSTEMIGTISLVPSYPHQKAILGYWLAEEHWNNGYMTEALSTLIQFGFEQLSLHKIYAPHFASNPASGKVMQKAGMEYEATLKDEYFKDGIFHDVHRYCIIKSSK